MQLMTTTTRWAGCLALATLFLAGCGGDPHKAKRVATFAVKGVVNYQGKPVEGATVLFEKEDHSQSAVGVTDKNGNFALQTYEPGDGAPAGSYYVTIKKLEAKTDNKAAAATDSGEYKGVEEVVSVDTATGEAIPEAAPKNLIPEKYSNPVTSGFKETISAAKTDLKYDLVD